MRLAQQEEAARSLGRPAVALQAGAPACCWPQAACNLQRKRVERGAGAGVIERVWRLRAGLCGR